MARTRLDSIWFRLSGFWTWLLKFAWLRLGITVSYNHSVSLHCSNVTCDRYCTRSSSPETYGLRSMKLIIYFKDTRLVGIHSEGSMYFYCCMLDLGCKRFHKTLNQNRSKKKMIAKIGSWPKPNNRYTIWRSTAPLTWPSTSVVN